MGHNKKVSDMHQVYRFQHMLQILFHHLARKYLKIQRYSSNNNVKPYNVSKSTFVILPFAASSIPRFNDSIAAGLLNNHASEAGIDI